MRYNYSVVVPYRDKYELFIKAVNSIPDREDIQIIVVDNAPKALLQDMVPHKDVALVTYTNSSPKKGAGCARNMGLKSVLGRYLLFLDADDYFTPDAFSEFDKYLDTVYDIVFFKPTSIFLNDGSSSDRHAEYELAIDRWLQNGDEGWIRYRWGSPWSKLFNTDFVLRGGYLFEETPVGNDAWFSLQTGHHANTIFASNAIVYVVTEGEKGQSLTKTTTRENALIRYKGAIRINKFLKSVGRYDMHIRLLGFLRIAYSNFGLFELVNYIKLAIKEKVCVI